MKTGKNTPPHASEKIKASLFSINKRLQHANRLKTLGVVMILIAVGGAITIFLKRPSTLTKKNALTNTAPIHFVGPISQEWGHKTLQSAIFAQQLRGDATAKHTEALSKQVREQHKKIDTLNRQVTALQKKMVHLTLPPMHSPTSLQRPTHHGASDRSATINVIASPQTTVSTGRRQAYRTAMMRRPRFPVYTPLALPNHTPKTRHKQASALLVPSGTFAKAVLLSGADANASVNGEKNTDPMLLRILDNGTLPNGHHSTLKGCFVTASIYGDISSERGQIRTELLSCIRPSGDVLNIAVQGTIVGSAGKNGLRGIPVMRNGKILWNAGISGGIAGLGSAAQKSQENQSSSPLGSVATVSGNYLSYAAYGGMKSAADQLARYYVQRAEQYHPIIQINPGSQVTIIFLKPFSLSTDQALVGMAHRQKKSATVKSMNTIRTTLTPQQQAAYQQYLKQVETSAHPVMNLPGVNLPPTPTEGGNE